MRIAPQAGNLIEVKILAHILVIVFRAILHYGVWLYFLMQNPCLLFAGKCH